MDKLLAQLYFDTVIALSEALEARDKYTAGHSTRVMEYAAGIAKHIGLNEKDLDRLKKSALLHDLGKIGIPDVILHKRSRLSDKEFAVIKKHPKIGADILRAIKPLSDLVPTIYHHHERFDGNGYPHGIKGEQIPLNARIIAVADSFDAMTSNRPYREAFSIETALLEIERNKGTQFDPFIVSAFIEILKTNPYYSNINMMPEYYL